MATERRCRYNGNRQHSNLLTLSNFFILAAFLFTALAFQTGAAYAAETWDSDTTINSTRKITDGVTVNADITLTIPEGTTLTDLNGIDKLTNLQELNVSGCTKLEKLDCSKNHLLSLDLSGFDNLSLVDCHSQDRSGLETAQQSDGTWKVALPDGLATGTVRVAVAGLALRRRK